MTPAQPCAAVHRLCEALPELLGILSLIVGSPGVPDETRRRCLGLWYQLKDGLDAEAEQVQP